jgi:HAE1 family hydrophobic/amphiphilic exporter-1
VRSENQDLPVGAIRSLQQERVVQIDARMRAPGLCRIIVARKNGAAIRLGQVARVHDGAQELEAGAVQRPAHPAAVGAESAGREHHRGGRRPERGGAGHQAELPPGVRLEKSATARPIRVAVDNVRQTLIEGAC